MSFTLSVTLLGEFAITYNNRPVAGINTARAQALLAYLLLHRHAPQPRQRLAFSLWPESSETQARTNLRKELSHLRRDLPAAEEWLLVDGKTLQWSPAAPFMLDVMAFEQSLARAEARDGVMVELKGAIALYQGDLLPGCEDDWIAPERARLKRLHISALEQLIEKLQAQHDYRTALNYAQLLLQTDTLNEATYCTLMRLYSQSGDRANALQVYHRCMTVLREELGVDPSAATRKLYETLLLEDGPAVEATAPPAVRLAPPSNRAAQPSPLLPLIGRTHEWDLIRAWASADSRNAPSPLLLLVGEPGIGKTRLLEELRETLPLVLWGRAFAAEMVRPYGIWIDALRSLALPTTMPPEVGFLLPEVGQPTAMPPDRSHLFDAVVQLLADWAAQSPLVVIFDDIQWIDEASSALLHYASRLLSHLPIRFACTARSGELSGNVAVSQVLRALKREQRVNTLELQALDRGVTADLIRTANACQAFDLSLEMVDQVFTDSGGNPLFVLEIARTLVEHPELHSSFAHGESLESLIGDRLQQLEPRAREVLFWAAALGRSFKPTTVAQVADCPLTQLLTAIEQLEQQSLIRPSAVFGHEVGYDFAHDIVRQVVYRQVSEPRRQLIHLQIAQQLNQRVTSDPALAGDIAHHAGLGGDLELAASAALLAAERCLKLFAYAEASTLARRGLEYGQGLTDRVRIRLQLQLLRVIAFAGVTCDGPSELGLAHRTAELETQVNQLMDEARRLGLKEEEAIGLEAIGIVYFNQNNVANTHQHSLRAVEISQSASPATAARLLAYSGSCLAELGHDVVRAEALLLEAQSLAARVGLVLVDIFSGLGAVHLHYGRYGEARPLLRQAWQLAQAEQDHWREFSYLSYLAMLELEVGDPVAALPCCQELAAVAGQIQGEGSEGAIATALTALAHYPLAQPQAGAALEQAIAQLHLQDAKRMLSYVLIGAAETDLEQGRWELAATRAETALAMAQIMQHASETALAWALLVQANLALGRAAPVNPLESLANQGNRSVLSFRAQNAVNQAMQQLQAVVSRRP